MPRQVGCWRGMDVEKILTFAGVIESSLNTNVMKQTPARSLVLFIIPALLLSCVSRKKFDNLARAKRSADSEVFYLTGEREALEEKVKQLQTTFNAERYKLTLNNAAKDKQIDELHATSRAREDRVSALRTELEDAGEEARQATETRDRRVAGLEERLRTVVTERDEARGQLGRLGAVELDNRKWKAEAERLAGEVTRLNKELETLKGQLETARKMLQELTRKAEQLKP